MGSGVARAGWRTLAVGFHETRPGTTARWRTWVTLSACVVIALVRRCSPRTSSVVLARHGSNQGLLSSACAPLRDCGRIENARRGVRMARRRAHRGRGGASALSDRSRQRDGIA